MSRSCAVSDCPNHYYAKGFCNKHWHRNRKHGDPHLGRNHAPPEERFWRFVEKAGPEDCWLWVGKYGGKYGQFQAGGKGSVAVGAHRYSYQMANDGEQPQVVMHKCDTPRCVNPAHLEAGTYKANMADMIAKGRHARKGPLGEANYNTKLKPDDVRAIRLRQGESANSVGRDYGINHKAILAIWRGITWTHID